MLKFDPVILRACIQRLEVNPFDDLSPMNNPTSHVPRGIRLGGAHETLKVVGTASSHHQRIPRTKNMTPF